LGKKRKLAGGTGAAETEEKSIVGGRRRGGKGSKTKKTTMKAKETRTSWELVRASLGLEMKPIETGIRSFLLKVGIKGEAHRPSVGVLGDVGK